MGNLKKKYSKPRRMYDSVRIEEEGNLARKYGLKNMREIWKAQAAVDKIREQAKKLITEGEGGQKKLFEKLNKIGFKVEKIADVLALNKEDWLNRRLQTIVFKKELASTINEARQLIVHGHITIRGNTVNSPSYMVNVDEEDKIKRTLEKKKVEEKKKVSEESEGKEDGENKGEEEDSQDEEDVKKENDAQGGEGEEEEGDKSDGENSSDQVEKEVNEESEGKEDGKEE